MRMDIQSHGFTLTDGINDSVTQRIACGLGQIGITRWIDGDGPVVRN